MLLSRIATSSQPEPRPQLVKCERWCLFLDVDGTLIDIAPTPDAVRVAPGLPTLLMDACRALGGALALVSGRPIATLDRLLAPRRWAAAGLHGLERRDATGRLHGAADPHPRLGEVRDTLVAAVACVPGALLEDKGITLAVHYRAAPAREPQLRRAVYAAAAPLGAAFHVLDGDHVLEIKPAAANKADAIRAFLAEPPFAGRRPIFIGDDLTDLDGFAAVEQAGGHSVAVGDRVLAQRRVASPREVHALLADLVEGRFPP
jgi:trehalose 6-phosphate phosphatase